MACQVKSNLEQGTMENKPFFILYYSTSVHNNARYAFFLVDKMLTVCWQIEEMILIFS